jgi:uncharacterized protein YbjQ (UPF0145 family)
LRDTVGGKSAGYERLLSQARETVIEEMVAEADQAGAKAVIGVDVGYESIQVGQGGEYADDQHFGHRRQSVALWVELSNLSTY